MDGSRPTRTLAAGLAVSLILHAAAAAALLNARWSRDDAPETPDAVAERESDREQARIELGDPRSQAITMTWIGFEEYREHAARQSVVEQPALTRTAPGAVRPALRELVAPATRAAARLREELREAASALASAAERAADVRATTRPDEGEAPKPTEVAAATPGAPDPVEPTQPEREAPTGAPGPEPGQADERESDPTSLVEASVRQLGQPLSARGLKITTVKPRFFHTTTVTARPRSPEILIEFKHDGRVHHAEVLTSSGYDDVDGPILDAIYNWTADGEALGALKTGDPPDTLGVRVRILL